MTRNTFSAYLRQLNQMEREWGGGRRGVPSSGLPNNTKTKPVLQKHCFPQVSSKLAHCWQKVRLFMAMGNLLIFFPLNYAHLYERDWSLRVHSIEGHLAKWHQTLWHAPRIAAFKNGYSVPLNGIDIPTRARFLTLEDAPAPRSLLGFVRCILRLVFRLAGDNANWICKWYRQRARSLLEVE